MTKLILTILLSFVIRNILAQNIEKFKDTDRQRWGLKNKQTDSIIVPALYPRISDFNDSLFIVNDPEKGMAIYNYNGKLMIDYDKRTLFTFIDLRIGDCPYDSIIHRKLFDVPMFTPRQEVNMRGYEINLNRECISNNYFPCPVWTKAKTDITTPEYLRLIQKGEEHRWNLQMDSAIYYCKKAIDLEPNNPASYFWGANVFIIDYMQMPKHKYDSSYKKYTDWIKYCLDNAEKYEDKTYYKLRILRTKKNFYKHFLNDGQTAKLIEKDIKELKSKCKKTTEANN